MNATDPATRRSQRLATSVVLAAALATSSASAEDLLDVYRAARSYDAQLASARYALEAGRERLPQGRAGLLPLLTATGFTQWNDVTNKIADRNFTFNSNGYTVTLSQPLFRWQNWVAYQQSELQVLQSESVFAQANQDLATRTAQAYFDVLAAGDTIEFVRTKKTAISEQLAQAKRNFEVGTATITDTNEAQARFDLSVAEEIAALNDLEIRRRALAQIAGRDFSRLTPLRPAAQIPSPEPNDMGRWVQTALEQSYAVRSQELAWEITRREVDRNRAAHLPTLDLVGTHGHNIAANQANTGVRSDLIVNTVGLQLAIPFYSGGIVESRIREAVANRERTRADLDNVRRNTEFTTRQAFLGLTNGIAQVRALEQSLKSSDVALASNKLGYEVGVRINIDVLNAQQQVFQTKRDLSKARYDTIMNGLRLKAASGTLTEDDLLGVNRLLGAD